MRSRFTEAKTVQVTLHAGGTRLLRGDRVFVAVGTRASIPGVPGLADARPMTHVEALNLQRLPEHLVVLGGGYVGLELAQAMRRFGSRVTIIERGDRLLGAKTWMWPTRCCNSWRTRELKFCSTPS